MNKTEKKGGNPYSHMIVFCPFGKQSLNHTPEKEFFTHSRQNGNHEHIDGKVTPFSPAKKKLGQLCRSFFHGLDLSSQLNPSIAEDPFRN